MQVDSLVYIKYKWAIKRVDFNKKIILLRKMGPAGNMTKVGSKELQNEMFIPFAMIDDLSMQNLDIKELKDYHKRRIHGLDYFFKQLSDYGTTRMFHVIRESDFLNTGVYRKIFYKSGKVEIGYALHNNSNQILGKMFNTKHSSSQIIHFYVNKLIPTGSRKKKHTTKITYSLKEMRLIESNYSKIEVLLCHQPKGFYWTCHLHNLKL